MYKLVVVELKDVVPRRDEGKPNLYVGFVDTEVEGLDDVVSHAKDWVRGHEVELRRDLSRDTIFSRKSRVKIARRKMASKLMGQGYTVNKQEKIWCVYVIELDPVGKGDVGRGYVYVGETSLPIEERYDQHRTDARNTADTFSLASNKTRGRVLSLRRDLIPPKGVYFSEEESKAAEARLAERLRGKGYRVEGGP